MKKNILTFKEFVNENSYRNNDVDSVWKKFNKKYDELNINDDFTFAYIDAALKTETDDDGNPLSDNFDVGDIDKKDLQLMIEDCKKFKIKCRSDLDEVNDDRMCGMLFWFTRNGHGDTFGLGTGADTIYNIAMLAMDRYSKSCGEAHLLPNDDNTLQYYVG